jgi:hypothetical protein
MLPLGSGTWCFAQVYFTYAILNNQKCHVFFFFSYTKLENRRAEQVPPGGLVMVGGWRRWGNGTRG